MQIDLSMSREKLHKFAGRRVRDAMTDAIDLSDEIHEKEKKLILSLIEIDKNKFYIRAGYKSLTAFTKKSLRFTETQTQRIVTLVRRSIPTPNIGQKEDSIQKFTAEF
ncbi:MAG: hypothetical protein ABL930_08480 [Pseudobdellovibrio sp.]